MPVRKMDRVVFVVFRLHAGAGDEYDVLSQLLVETLDCH